MAKTREEIIRFFEKAQLIQYPKRPLKDGTILDENKSVKWNREQVELSKKKFDDEITAYRRARNDIYRLAEEETYQYIQDELEKDYPLTKCAYLYQTAYEDGHAYGYQEVFNKIDELIDFMNEMNR